MNKDQAKQSADQALQTLAQALEQGRSDAMVEYLDTLAKFHRYSYRNVMLIRSQKKDSTRVAGFRSWKKLGRYVCQGEHGITILAPIVYKKQTDTDEKDEVQTLHGFKAVTVFDVSQTDGKPLPDFAHVTGSPKLHLDQLQAFAADRGITVTFDYIKPDVLGMSTGGTVIVRPDLSEAETFSVLSHEIAHELLHKTQRPASKTIRETEAEAVAYTVSRAIGLETNTAASDYIQLYNGDKQTLAKSLDRIQQVAAEIIANLAA